MFDSILVVCMGNICRSPTGEGLLKKIFPNKQISSAGITALVGKSADKMAINIAKQHGLNIEDHKAQQFTSSLALNYDLILVMEKEHISRLTTISPELRGKIMLFGHWHNGIDIPDPYRKSSAAFEYVYQLLEISAKKWAEKINK